MCLAEQLFFSARWKRGRTLGRDPCGLAMRRTEAALSPGVPGGQAVVLDMLIPLTWRAAYNWTEKDIPNMYYFYKFVCVLLIGFILNHWFFFFYSIFFLLQKWHVIILLGCRMWSNNHITIIAFVIWFTISRMVILAAQFSFSVVKTIQIMMMPPLEYLY